MADSPVTLELPVDVMRVVAWVDPVVDALGFDPRSDYVELFWLGVIGPSTTWLMRRLAAGLDRSPEGFTLDLIETARALGIGGHGGLGSRNSPFARTLVRPLLGALGTSRSLSCSSARARTQCKPSSAGGASLPSSATPRPSGRRVSTPTERSRLTQRDGRRSAAPLLWRSTDVRPGRRTRSTPNRTCRVSGATRPRRDKFGRAPAGQGLEKRSSSSTRVRTPKPVPPRLT